jgi:hypothetical protein
MQNAKTGDIYGLEKNYGSSPVWNVIKRNLYKAKRYVFNAYTKAKTGFIKEQVQKMIDFLKKRQV